MNIMAATLKLACNDFAPARYPCAMASGLAVTRECPTPGIEAELVQAILKGANINFTLIPIPETNGSVSFFQNLYQFIESGRVDGACQLFAATSERLSRFLMSASFETNSRLVATSVPSHTSVGSFNQWFKFAYLFDWRLLLTLFLIYSAVKLFERQVVLRSPFANDLKLRKRLFDSWLMVYALIGLVFGLFLNLYTTSVLSYLLVPDLQRKFNNLEGLVQLVGSKSIQIYTPANTGWITRLFQQDTKDRLLMDFRANLQKQPIVDTDDFDGLSNSMLDAYRTGGTVIYHSINLRELVKDYCEMTVIDLPELGKGQPSSVMFAKNMSRQLLDSINESIRRNMNILVTITQKFERTGSDSAKNAKCRGPHDTDGHSETEQQAQLTKDGERKKTHPRANVIQISEIIGLLILFLCGCLIALVLFCCERNGHCATSGQSPRHERVRHVSFMMY